MTLSNLYITTASFLNWQRSTSVDTSDDGVIGQIIEQTSRMVDNATGRQFYPSYETRLYDIPKVDFTDRDTIQLDADLLSLTTLTNGDGTVITSTDYILRSINSPPYWSIKLRDTSSVNWEPSSAGSNEQVISVAGVWGFHGNYSRAWVQAGTLGAAISSTSTLSATMTAGHTLASQQIWKIDNEILQGTVSTNTLTFNARGDNGSTAATHLINAPVYVWQITPSVSGACQLIVDSFYKKRFGETAASVATITAAGVVLTPSDIPASAWRLLAPLMRQA